jgi:hypothetical protein
MFVILSLLCLWLTLVPKGFSQTQSVSIIGYSWYVDETGGLDVVGQVQNVGSSTVNPVILTGTVFAPGGEVASTSACQVWVSYLTPGQKAPFYMEFMPPEESTGWSPDYIGNISLSVAKATPTNSYQYPDLKITSSSASIGTAATGAGLEGAYVVNGVIKNTGTQAATNVTVVGAFFNSTGNVVGVGYTDYLTPTVLAPSAITTFQIEALDLNQSLVPPNLKIYSYSLLVQTGAPILNGTAPSPTSSQSSGTSAPTSSGGSSTSSSSSSTQASTKTQNSINTTIYVIVIAVVILAAAAIGAALVLRRGNYSKPHQTTKEARKAKKQKAR